MAFQSVVRTIKLRGMFLVYGLGMLTGMIMVGVIIVVLIEISGAS